MADEPENPVDVLAHAGEPPGAIELEHAGKLSPSAFLSPTPGMPSMGAPVGPRLRAAYDKILNTSPKFSEHAKLGKRPPIDAALILKNSGVTPEELFEAHNSGELEGMTVANSTYSKVGGRPVVIRHPDGREKAAYHGLVFN
jgi:hypothetical protein